MPWLFPDVLYQHHKFSIASVANMSIGICPLNMTIDDWKKRLEQEVSYAWKIVGVFAALAVILVAMLVYCIIRIIWATAYYIKRKKDTQAAAKKTLTFMLPKGIDLNDSKQDDEIYEGRMAEAARLEAGSTTNDYYVFQDTINKSLSEYKSLNDKITDFYKRTRNEDAPDQYDRRIFDRNNDNW